MCGTTLQIPHHHWLNHTDCVGPSSQTAGTASSCEGCPNRSACASGAGRQVDPAVQQVADRLSSVKHVIMVLSGKGGVGKSTVSSQIAFELASQGYEVGLLDIDICGPSAPRMFALEGQVVRESGSGWSPVYVADNLGVMSIGFMLSDKDDAVIWRGPRKNGLIKQFLSDVDWGDIDCLVIDTPPGTSDEHITTVQYLKETPVDGAIVVTTPQDVAINDVRKELTFCKKSGLSVIGVVENMSGFVCPHCNCESEIFPPGSSGGAVKMATDFQVPFLGKLPIDPMMARACEAGKLYGSSG